MGLHWLLAFGVLEQFCLGWWMRSLPDKTGEQAWWFNLHKSFGLTIFMLALVLLVWRLRHPPPPLPETMPLWQRWSAKACQWHVSLCDGHAHQRLHGLVIHPLSYSVFRHAPAEFLGLGES
jgi:cytochrome b561